TQKPQGKIKRLPRESIIQRFCRVAVLSQHKVLGGQFRDEDNVARVQSQCLLEVPCRVLPIALSSLDVATQCKGSRVTGQAASGQLEFGQRGRIIAAAPIVKKRSR